MVLPKIEIKNEDLYVGKKIVDVICQHATTGCIFPIKVKIRDEEGEYQVYRILRFRELRLDGMRIFPNGEPSGDHIWSYECIISVFGSERRIFLLYHILDGIWTCQTHKR